MTNKEIENASVSYPQSIQIHECNIGDDRDICFSDASHILSRDERDRVARFHFDRHRQRFARARAFLRRVLAEETGQDAPSLTLEYGPNGKPELRDERVDFNLSHTQDLAVLVVSRVGTVGVDVELIDRDVDPLALAKTVLTPEERQALSNADEAEQTRLFFAYWTAKEARMKLTGQGMSLPPMSISLRLQDGWPIGYDVPSDPPAALSFVELSNENAMCCVSFLEPSKD